MRAEGIEPPACPMDIGPLYGRCRIRTYGLLGVNETL